MLTAKEIRESFKDFFASKQHQIVPSAPMVVKGDPTLMFTNAALTVYYSGKSATYTDENIIAPDHDSEYEIRENKINAAHYEKSALVKRRVKLSWSKKRALVASYPLLPAFFEKI